MARGERLSNVDSMASDDRLRVFVSYAHDSEEHKICVLQFCRLLRRHGVDAWLDRYDGDERRDWYAWYVDQVAVSDYVLVIASPGYRAVGDGNGSAGHHRSVQAEAAHLRDLLHADRPTWTRRLLPVVLPGRSIRDIPVFLQPSGASHYVVSALTLAGITDLLRTLTRQNAYPPPVLGPILELPPETVPTAATVPSTSMTSETPDRTVTQFQDPHRAPAGTATTVYQQWVTGGSAGASGPGATAIVNHHRE